MSPWIGVRDKHQCVFKTVILFTWTALGFLLGLVLFKMTFLSWPFLNLFWKFNRTKSFYFDKKPEVGHVNCDYGLVNCKASFSIYKKLETLFRASVFCSIKKLIVCKTKPPATQIMEGIEIIEVATKGKGLIARKTYEPGQLVLREKAHAYVVMSNHVTTTCHYCLASSNIVSLYSSNLKVSFLFFFVQI